MDDKITREAVKYINNALSLYLWDANWDEPDEKDLDALRSEIRYEDLEKISEESEIPLACLKAFVDGGDISANPDNQEEDEYNPDNSYLKDLVRYIKENMILQDPLDVDEKTIVSICVSTGGPGLDVDFTVNKHGEMIKAAAVYRNWGAYHQETLPDRIAQDLWEKYSYKGDEIRERNESRPYPGY